VVTKDGNPVPYAIAHLQKYDVYDTTDSKGEYEIAIESDGISSMLSKAADGTGDSLQILKDGQIITSLESLDYIDTLPDIVIVQRNIGGGIDPAVTEFSKVEAIVWNKADTIQRVAELFYSKPTHSYSGFVYFVYARTKQEYAVYVNVYSTDSLFVGRSDTISFTSTAGDIVIPLFDPRNAYPVPEASAVSAVGINDTIELSGTASDKFGGRIVKWEWDAGNTGKFVETTPDSNFAVQAPAEANEEYECVLRVTDDDGNTATDVVTVDVQWRPPEADAGSDTAVGINDTIKLHGTGTDETVVAKYEWKLGASDWIETSSGDTNIIAPSTATWWWVCSLRVTDDDGNGDYDFTEIKVGSPAVSDFEGNMYQTVKIGNQEWTAANLRTTKYNDGTAIPHVAGNTEWSSLSTGACSFYDNTTDTGAQEKYGALYNWYAVNSGKLAPPGWHVATDTEWTELENYLIANGYNWDGTTNGNKIGKSLAAKTDWNSSSTKGNVGNDLSSNNSSGFSALPGGLRYDDGNFLMQNSYGVWWSSTDSVARVASTEFTRNLFLDDYELTRRPDNKRYGFSVRLVRD
jgi:uncharacterized protein (TIGR02145 family)